MRIFTLLVALLPFLSMAQVSSVHDIPLPEDLSKREQSVVMYSTPNPNWAEPADSLASEVVWKHSTIIKAKEPITITETGAYVLSYGTWWQRATFNDKETRKMFNASSLKLEAGDSIVFKENWRYDSATRSGWNFWYVKATADDGRKLYGYELLETKGSFEDGTAVLPLDMNQSSIAWSNGNEGEYVVEGTVESAAGRLFVRNDSLQMIEVSFDMQSLSNDIEDLTNHLKGKDFLWVEKHPKAWFKPQLISNQGNNQYEIQGQLCLRGECQQETFRATVVATRGTYNLNFNVSIDRTRYGILYASEVQPHPDYSIPHQVTLSGTLAFSRDFPGSNPYNTIEKKP